MESIWTQGIDIPHRESLKGTISAEVAVIGGGMAGILTAYLLQRQGVQAVVLEAERIGSGQTKNTTAKITSQHGLIYHQLTENFGRIKASQYAKANERAIGEYRRIIQKEHIDCHFEELPAYIYSYDKAGQMEREAEAARRLGIDAEFVTETELPFPVKGAVRFGGQAQFHPLEFLRAIAEPLTIYEQTPVKTIEDMHVFTKEGIVLAKHIVIATHYPFLNVPGYYFMRMHQERSYVLALENAIKLQGMYIGVDNSSSYSFRSYENLLLLGGGQHRTGENSAGGRYKMLKKAAKGFYPNSQIKAAWSAQDCMPVDGIPYIGQFSSSTPHVYVATGFQKWGMTSSMVSAMVLTDSILEKDNIVADIFSPLRFNLSVSAKTLAQDTLQSVKGLAREFFAPPRDQMDKLPNGHGGVVEHEGHKIGVYKDEQGKVYAVSTKCTHLGCQLEWNPDELSWDCPCHGSRFDYKGNLIDNPAMENLPHG